MKDFTVDLVRAVLAVVNLVTPKAQGDAPPIVASKFVVRVALRLIEAYEYANIKK